MFCSHLVARQQCSGQSIDGPRLQTCVSYPHEGVLQACSEAEQNAAWFIPSQLLLLCYDGWIVVTETF